MAKGTVDSTAGNPPRLKALQVMFVPTLVIITDRRVGGGSVYHVVYYYNLIWFDESIAFFHKNAHRVNFLSKLWFLPDFSLF